MGAFLLKLNVLKLNVLKLNVLKLNALKLNAFTMQAKDYWQHQTEAATEAIYK